MDKQMSERLKDAITYELEKQKEPCIKDSKPGFHACPPVGWINDPNGFSCYKGEYHLFYQYYPYDTHWGPMHWGHCKSKDLIDWEYLPCAMAPDMDYDGKGCFSGTAIEDDGQDDSSHVLMYTSVLEKDLEDGTRLIRQTQSIAVGDGISYEKLLQNPIITADLLPVGSSLEDFRDPKIWKDGNIYYAVIGSKNAAGEGQLALFSSENLLHWEFEKILDSSQGRYGKMWECPDFFSLDGRQVLIVSPMAMKEEGLEFHEGSNSIYFIGDYDKKAKVFTRDRAYQIDYGPDFYAPETLATPDGRQILIGWMQNWENYLTPETFQWSGMMTVPRELRIEKGRLIQVPVRELDAYHVKPVRYEQVRISSEVELDGVSGRCLDMNVEIAGGDYDRFTILLAADDEHSTALIYNKMEQTLTIDRTNSGMQKDNIKTRSMYVPCQDGCEDVLKLRIIMDKYSIEVFANDGRQVMTALIYTPREADGIRFEVQGEAYVSVEKYDVVV